MPIGLTLPFAKSTSSLGSLAYSTSQLQATYYNLKSLLLTDWGERPNHYEMGCNLTEFLFNPNTKTVQDQVSERIRNQVSAWLPYVVLNKIDVTNPSDHTLTVIINFSLRSKQDTNSVIKVSVSQT